jgi:hypothetical protein
MNLVGVNDPKLTSELERCLNKQVDKNLNFGHHVNQVCKKLNKSLNCINTAKFF